MDNSFLKHNSKPEAIRCNYWRLSIGLYTQTSATAIKTMTLLVFGTQFMKNITTNNNQ